ncbi:glucose-dependent insulinotropic receptor [Paramormyrops kingsleyae]|uniref:glucose-dependent insulinotropic receptor n=1 Tax=Paramormyrops kingsleyae TaxID=1676925 RepID=UPI000CD623B1|nr:glucose-dependent insulinotropic receptor [Paramormyrops kingsleyae]
MELEILGWILGVSSVLIISTNVLVAASLVLLIRKKGGQSWCFVLNLALADTLVGVAIIGISVIAINSETSPIHRTKCLMFMALVTSPSAASILTMFLVSLDRYIAIKLPLRYSRISRTRTTAVALVTLWALSFVVGFLPGMVTEMQVEEYNGTCTFFSVIQPKSIILVFCICFFPVLLIFIYFYLDILKIACGHQRQIRIARLAGSQVPLPSRFGRHVKALRTVALLVGCFTLSWCPFFIVSVVQVLCQACMLYSVIETYLWLLGLSNSLINPLVYAFWQREVRQELSAIFTSLKGRLSRVAPLTTFRGRHSEDTVLPGTTVLGNCHIQTISRGVGVAHPTTALAIVTTSF